MNDLAYESVQMEVVSILDNTLPKEQDVSARLAQVIKAELTDSVRPVWDINKLADLLLDRVLEQLDYDDALELLQRAYIDRAVRSITQADIQRYLKAHGLEPEEVQLDPDLERALLTDIQQSGWHTGGTAGDLVKYLLGRGWIKELPRTTVGMALDEMLFEHFKELFMGGDTCAADLRPIDKGGNAAAVHRGLQRLALLTRVYLEDHGYE